MRSGYRILGFTRTRRARMLENRVFVIDLERKVPPARTSPPPLLRGANIKSNVKTDLDLTPLTRGSLHRYQHLEISVRGIKKSQRSGGIFNRKLANLVITRALTEAGER
jgi:hypothetical protein